MRTISQLPRTRASLGVLAVFVALMAIPAATQRGAGNEPVRVEGGLISGTTEDGGRAYKGIPYAAPPVGDLRWKPPQPVVAWTGVRSSDTVGAACPHLARAAAGFLAEVTEPKREDCLFLDVWTAARPGDRRPVMVWYHGGGWRSGSGTPVDKESDLRNAQRVGGHRTFNLPMRTWARLATAAGRSKTFMYYFSHVPPHPAKDQLGAYHTGEIPYVFNDLGQHTWAFQPHDYRLADLMSSYWVQFATAGDPNGGRRPQWVPFDLRNEPYLEFGETVAVRHHLLKPQLDFIEQVQQRRSTFD